MSTRANAAPQLPGSVHVMFTTPGGVILKAYSDPDAITGWSYCPVRVCLGILEDPDTGLLREMEGGLPAEDRVPWENAAIRREAMEATCHLGSWLPKETKAKLLAHIDSTPYFD